MKRIRTQLALLTFLVGILGIGATAYYLTQAYIADKRNYVVEMSSSAAPKIADALSKKVSDLISKTALYESSSNSGPIPRYLGKLYDGVVGLAEVRTYAGGQLRHRIPLDSTAPLEENLILPDPRSITGAFLVRIQGSRDLILLAPPTTSQASGFYLFRVHPAFFQASFDLAPAFLPTLVDPDGVFFPGPTEAEIDPNRFKPILSNLNSASVLAREFGNRTGGRSLFILSRISGISNATLIVQAPISDAYDLIRPIFRSSLPFLLAVLLVSVLLSFLLAAKVARPIEELTSAASLISRGEWSAPVQRRSSYEISRLVRAFSKMVKDLESREKQIDKANRELVQSERLAVLGKFGAGIAHEVKNPLASILGYAQLVRRKLPGPLADKEIQFVDFIMEETKRASKIISDLLVFARQKTPELREQPITPVLSRALEMLSSQAAEHGVELKFESSVATEDDRISLDPDPFFQVLTNIISNAVQALEESARLPKWIKLGLSRAGEQLILKITDNGPGISPENLPRVFEPFFSTKAVGKGTGLGLALSLGIIEQHGGRLEVSSDLGVGTTFQITLPIKSPSVG